jgi:hypothetical protein
MPQGKTVAKGLNVTKHKKPVCFRIKQAKE